MKNQKLSFLFVGIGIVIFMAFVYYNLVLKDSEEIEENSRSSATVFDDSEIVGRIKYVSQATSHGHSFVMVETPKILYRARISFTGNDRGKDFRWVAKPGDSIIKHRNSDTLTLIQKDAVYYTKCRNMRR